MSERYRLGVGLVKVRIERWYTVDDQRHDVEGDLVLHCLADEKRHGVEEDREVHHIINRGRHGRRRPR